MSGVPNVFGSATSSIPLSQLDVNFNTPVTIGNATVGLGNTTTIVGNLTVQNVTLSSTNGDANIHGLTVGQGGGSVATNTAVGASALAGNSTGSNNTAVGYQAGYTLSAVANQTFLGYQAGYNRSTGNDNYSTVMVGNFAGYSTSTGIDNTYIGGYAARFQTGSSNTALGGGALYGVNGTSTGSNNTALGYGSLLSNTTASNNTAVGYQAGYTNSTGASNVALGYQALYSISTTNTNVAVGTQAGYTCTGASNTFLGNGAGYGLAGGNFNTYVGSGATQSGTTVSYEIVICTTNTSIAGKGSSTAFISPNGGAAYQGNNSNAWSVSSDERLKKNIVDNTVGLTAINGIKVRNFEYRLPDEITDLDKSNAVAITGVQLGTIAQELQQVLPDCVKTESTGVMSVDSSDVLWHLVTAVQQLSAQVTTLQSKVGV